MVSELRVELKKKLNKNNWKNIELMVNKIEFIDNPEFIDSIEKNRFHRIFLISIDSTSKTINCTSSLSPSPGVNFEHFYSFYHNAVYFGIEHPVRTSDRAHPSAISREMRAKLSIAISSTE